MRRTETEVISEVQDFCKTPQKQSHIQRKCNLCYRVFIQLVEKGVIRLHHKEKSTGRFGSHYYIAHNSEDA